MPACAGKIFAPTINNETKSLTQVVISVLNKAGFDVYIPQESQSMCCGITFSSKGDEENSNKISTKTQAVLLKASENGRYPIMIDASACALHLNQSNNAVKVYESAEFLNQFVVDALDIKPKTKPVMLHVTCSSKRGHIEQHLVDIAERCAEQVKIPADINCCAFAGDKGFYLPQLNKHALKSLKAQKPSLCEEGYSNNRSCEIGLTRHSGVPYQSIFYLLDEVSEPKVISAII
jgi:D-lactate dehydrogenase